MDGSRLPPRPHLFGCERKIRREQTEIGREGDQQRRIGRCRQLGSMITVPPRLHQLDVVVTEIPEGLLDLIERRRVVVVLELLGREPHEVRETLEHPTVDRHRDRPSGLGLEQRELRGVEQLGGEPAAHLHLSRFEGRVGARTPACGPISHAVRPVLFEERHGCDDVALGLRHLLSIGVEHPSRDGRVLPRQRLVLEVRAEHRGKQPGADDVVCLRTHVHRKYAGEQVWILEPAACDLRGQRRGRPGVHDVRIAGEAIRLVSLRGRVPVGNVCGGIERQTALVRQQWLLVVDAAIRLHRIPHGKRYAEEPLAADAPVARQTVHPILVARPHVLRMPLQLASACQQRVTEVHRLDEPLAAGDDFKRTVTLLVELHGMRDGARLAHEVARFAQQLDDLRPRFVRGIPRELVVALLGACRVGRFPSRGAPGQRLERAVGKNDRTHRERQLAPPRDVGDVAERADHRDAAPLLRIRQRVRFHRDPDAKERRDDLAPEQRPISLVVGMGHERDACRDQLGTGRLDLDEAAGRPPEPDPVVGARLVPVLELGLCHRGAEVHVPQRRRLELVGETALEQSQERRLRHALRLAIDRLIGLPPVDRETQMSPQVLKGLFVLDREPRAELDEIRARHRDGMLRRLLRRREGGVVRERRIAPDAVVVLHAPLGREPVVIPPHRVEHFLATHPLEARDDVGVRVGEDVAHVKRAAHGRRRRIDRVDPGT